MPALGRVKTRPRCRAGAFTLPEKTAEERVLGEDELRRLYAAARTLADLRGKLFRLVMLTGCRRTEIGQLRWSEVHRLDDPALAEKSRLPPSRTKSGAETLDPTQRGGASRFCSRFRVPIARSSSPEEARRRSMTGIG